MSNNNKPKGTTIPDEEKAIFGGEKPVTNTEKPITNQNAIDNTDPDMSQIPTETLTTILNRLNQLENEAGARAKADETDIFDPMEVFKGDRTCRVSYIYNEKTGNNDLVVGYKTRKMPNGTETATWQKKDPITGELRGKCTLVVIDSDTGKEYTLEDTDHYDFLQSITTREVPIKERTDVGQSIKQGTTNQTIWNGKTLAPTPTRVQTGYIEQRFEYDVEIDGKMYHLLQNVVNIR